MDWQIAFTLLVVLVALIGMVTEFAAPDLVLMGALFTLAAVGILSPEETFAGFSNPAVMAIGALFMVSAALRETGALDLFLGRLIGRARTVGSGVVRTTGPVAFLSAFLNNAPIVAMMTPAVSDWARRQGFSPSRFLLPISYASVLGSCNTMIGTSVNLTVAGLMVGHGMAPMGFFELMPAGLPIALAGLVYLVFVATRFLPDRGDPSETLGERRREYTAAMRVQPDCPLVGQSIEEAGLRRLPGLFLIEIDRSGRVITPVSPDDTIEASDRLVFAGVVSTIVDLQRIRGLVPEQAEAEEAPPEPPPLIGRGRNERLVEAVVSASSPLVGRSIRDSDFRSAYDAVVIAVHRNGGRVPGKIGEIVLRNGDTLLLQCSSAFLRVHRNSPDFYLVSELEGSGGKPRYERAWLAVVVLLAMVGLVSTGVFPIQVAAFLAAGFLVLSRCLTGPQARESVQWSVLVVIGAVLGIATAMENTGTADAVAGLVVLAAGDLGAMGALVLIYFVCVLMAETLHHNAAVAIMFPIAVATAGQVDADPRGFVMGVALAACCSFASPVAYQAHLIVYGPGGYRFTDFVKVGLPLDLLCGAIALTVIPWIWPF